MTSPPTTTARPRGLRRVAFALAPWFVLAAAAGCGAPGDGTVSQNTESITGAACVLTTYDGLNIFRRSCSDGMIFYTSDGNTYNRTGSRTGLEWQCVEWTNRYFRFRWGTPMPWYGNATDKCSSRPSSVSIVATPWWGDMVVFRPNACLRVSSTGSCLSRADPTYGHVGIVTGFPTTTTMRVRDQNAGQNSYNDYLRAAVGSSPSPVQCYLRDSRHVCQIGSTRSCTVGSCTGTQPCASTGRSWGACAATSCPDAGAADARTDARSDATDASSATDANDVSAPPADAGGSDADDAAVDPDGEPPTGPPEDPANDPSVIDLDADPPDARSPSRMDARGENAGSGAQGCECAAAPGHGVRTATFPAGALAALAMVLCVRARRRR